MDEHEAIQRIIALCSGSNSIIVQLRSQRTLDLTNYQDLVHHIGMYQAILGTRTDIHRTVVACLFDLVDSLDNIVYVSLQHGLPLAEHIEFAHAEIRDIVTNLLTIPEQH